MSQIYINTDWKLTAFPLICDIMSDNCQKRIAVARSPSIERETDFSFQGLQEISEEWIRKGCIKINENLTKNKVFPVTHRIWVDPLRIHLEFHDLKWLWYSQIFQSDLVFPTGSESNQILSGICPPWYSSPYLEIVNTRYHGNFPKKEIYRESS